MNKKQPVIFIGHGSPMNAIEDNEFSKAWKEIGNKLDKPKGIICISAHWYIDKSATSNNEAPKQIYDMYGFPEELYQLKYEVQGSNRISEDIKACNELISIDNSWGIDHGTWSVLVHMFPKADIPVVQISIDSNKTFEDHYQLAQSLQSLRNNGYLIVCSGNIVHNLANINFVNPNGLPKLMEFDDYIKEAVINKDIDLILEPSKHKYASYCLPTPDHYIPLIYALGLSSNNDKVTVFNNKGVYSTLSMTSFIFKEEQ